MRFSGETLPGTVRHTAFTKRRVTLLSMRPECTQTVYLLARPVGGRERLRARTCSATVACSCAMGAAAASAASAAASVSAATAISSSRT